MTEETCAYLKDDESRCQQAKIYKTIDAPDTPYHGKGLCFQHWKKVMRELPTAGGATAPTETSTEEALGDNMNLNNRIITGGTVNQVIPEGSPVTQDDPRINRTESDEDTKIINREELEDDDKKDPVPPIDDKPIYDFSHGRFCTWCGSPNTKRIGQSKDGKVQYRECMQVIPICNGNPEKGGSRTYPVMGKPIKRNPSSKA